MRSTRASQARPLPPAVRRHPHALAPDLCLQWAKLLSRASHTQRQGWNRHLQSIDSLRLPKGLVAGERLAQAAEARYGKGGGDAVRCLCAATMEEPTDALVSSSASLDVFRVEQNVTGWNEASLQDDLSRYAADYQDWFPVVVGTDRSALLVKLSRENPFAPVAFEVDRRLIRAEEVRFAMPVMPRVRMAMEAGQGFALYGSADVTDALVTFALGPCVAVSVHDRKGKAGLLAHADSIKRADSLGPLLARIPKARYEGRLVGGDGSAESNAVFFALKARLEAAGIPIVETQIGERGQVQRPIDIALMLKTGKLTDCSHADWRRAGTTLVETPRSGPSCDGSGGFVAQKARPAKRPERG